MKNYSIILAGILSLALVACGSDTDSTKKDDDKGGNGDTTSPNINKALAKAGTGDAAVKSWLIVGTIGKARTAGPDITAPPKYGTVGDDGTFTEQASATAITQIPFLQIGSKVYHHIKPSAKLLLESGGLEVRYLGSTAPKASKANLLLSLQAIKADATAKDGDTEAKPVKYTGIVNAQWTNDTIPAGIKYFAEKAADDSGQSKSADVDTTAATEEVIGGSVEVTVDFEGKATITPSDIGNSAGDTNSAGSEDFGWMYGEEPIEGASLGATGTDTEKKVTASKVWKPARAPVIEITLKTKPNGKEDIDKFKATEAPYTLVDADSIAFFDTTEVGGKISLTYVAAKSIVATTSDLLNADNDWQTESFTKANKIKAGLYSLVPAKIITGRVDLAFVAYPAAE